MPNVSNQGENEGTCWLTIVFGDGKIRVDRGWFGICFFMIPEMLIASRDAI